MRRKIISWLLRSSQKDLQLLKGNLEKHQYDGMLSQVYQNQAFRNYCISRENELVLFMANATNKPSDEQYLVAYGKRLEIARLHNEARLAYNRTQDTFKKKQSTPASPQA